MAGKDRGRGWRRRGGFRPHGRVVRPAGAFSDGALRYSRYRGEGSGIDQELVSSHLAPWPVTPATPDH
jgi:hypothetical protein